MNNVSINKTIHLSQHYTLGEMTKTGTGIPNIPSRVSIENLRNICENWLEEMRYDYNTLYCLKPGEDLNSILTGITQYKGNVHFEVCKPTL